MILYAVAMAVMALRSKSVGSFRVFSIGARENHPILIGMAVSAGSVSSTTFVINPGLVWKYGFAAFVAIGLVSTLGFLFGLAVFSKSFRRVGDRFNALTVAQWIGDRFGSERLRIFFGCISLFQIAYLVLITVALAQVLSKGLGVDPVQAAVVVIAFTCAYITLGGTSTHILTNTVQAVMMGVVALLLLFSGIRHVVGGDVPFFEELARYGPHYASWINPESDLYRDFFETFVAQFVIAAASALLPHLVVKALYLRDESEVNVYLATASFFVILFKMVTFAGLYARMEIDGTNLTPDTVMATYFVTHFSPFVRALITLGVLAAGFSTLEAIALALSSIFASDVVQPVAKLLGLSAPRDLRLARIFFVLLVPLTSLLAWRQLVAPSLSVIIFAFNGILAVTAVVVAPVLFGIYAKTVSVRAAFVSACCALAVFYTMTFGELTRYHTNPMVPGTFAVVASLVSYAIVSALDSRRSVGA